MKDRSVNNVVDMRHRVLTPEWQQARDAEMARGIGAGGLTTGNDTELKRQWLRKLIEASEARTAALIRKLKALDGVQ